MTKLILSYHMQNQTFQLLIHMTLSWCNPDADSLYKGLHFLYVLIYCLINRVVFNVRIK